MLLLLVTLAIALPEGSVGQQIYAGIGAGTSTCGSWSANRRSKSQLWYSQGNWVLGFLSGVGFIGIQNGYNPLHGLDAGAVSSWLDNYCQAHPLEPLAAAAEALVAEHPH
jgi:hypothetical protein